MLKQLARNTYLYTMWFNYRVKLYNSEKLNQWEKNGKLLPPPHEYKQSVIIEYSKKFTIKTLIETGTFQGHMINMLKYQFKHLESVELDEKLYNAAKERFSTFKHITIHHGDSSDILPEILKDLRQPTLFWLDGHYSEGITAKGALNTPIMKELTHILNHAIKKHVILIDDARLFNGRHDYPTLYELEGFIKNIDRDLKCFVKDDIIRIYR